MRFSSNFTVSAVVISPATDSSLDTDGTNCWACLSNWNEQTLDFRSCLSMGRGLNLTLVLILNLYRCLHREMWPKALHHRAHQQYFLMMIVTVFVSVKSMNWIDSCLQLSMVMVSLKPKNYKNKFMKFELISSVWIDTNLFAFRNYLISDMEFLISLRSRLSAIALSSDDDWVDEEADIWCNLCDDDALATRDVVVLDDLLDDELLLKTCWINEKTRKKSFKCLSKQYQANPFDLEAKINYFQLLG